MSHKKTKVDYEIVHGKATIQMSIHLQPKERKVSFETKDGHDAFKFQKSDPYLVEDVIAAIEKGLMIAHDEPRVEDKDE